MGHLVIGIVLCGTVLMPVGDAWTAEPVTPIGSLLVNPSAVHRKIFRLEGVAKRVLAHFGSELGTNQAMCGAEFYLQDSSGRIPV